MNFRRDLLTRPLSAILTAAVVAAALSIPSPGVRAESEGRSATNPAYASYLGALKAEAHKSFRYGLDRHNAPFAQKGDGARGSFVTLSPEHLKLQITKGGLAGEVEFARTSERETLTRFQARGGQSLMVRTRTVAEGGADTTTADFQYGDKKVTLKMDGGAAGAVPAPGADRELARFAAEVRKDRALRDLLGEAGVFSDRAVLSGAMSAVAYSSAAVDSLECIIDFGECILIIGAYIGSVGGLIALCPETIGATCLGALLLHPVIAVLVAAKCAKALRTCGVTPPPPPTRAQYQAACLAAGGYWDSFTGDCYEEPVCSLQIYPCYSYEGEVWDPVTCSCQPAPPTSPVLIDVLGNGFDLSDAAGGVNFDLNADAAAERLSWTRAGSDDAWLALDRNHNGTIDDGQELFGNFTLQPAPPAGEEKNGFRALEVYDYPWLGGNSDGQISEDDAVFFSLRLWRDANHNGVSEASELRSLPELGLRSIDLDYKTSKRTDQHGNSFRYRAKVRDKNGAQLGRWAWDVFLLRAP